MGEGQQVAGELEGEMQVSSKFRKLFNHRFLYGVG